MFIIGFVIMVLIKMVVILIFLFFLGKYLVFRLLYWEFCFLCNSLDIWCYFWWYDFKGLNNNFDDKW